MFESFGFMTLRTGEKKACVCAYVRACVFACVCECVGALMREFESDRETKNAVFLRFWRD